MRVYQGILKRGDTIYNVNLKNRIKLPRLIRMHSDEMEDVNDIGAGEICAVFGVDCYSGDTFTDGKLLVTLTSMHVPDPVISLFVKSDKKQDAVFTKALQRYQKEDPTFRVKQDEESEETVISGMGELHLEIYVERLRREYNCNVTTGKPKVAFRETPTTKATFEYLHKKQSGGRGQFAKVIGYIEPIRGQDDEDAVTFSLDTEFVDKTIGGTIPPEFIPAVKKGFEDVLNDGPLLGQPVVGCRMVVTDGAFHPVDSSELAFRLCTRYAFKKGLLNAEACILEPIMKVEVTSPAEFQNIIIPQLVRRKAVVEDSLMSGDFFSCSVLVPLNNMFGYSTELRSATEGKGEFSMEYNSYQPCATEAQTQLVAAYQKELEAKKKQ